MADPQKQLERLESNLTKRQIVGLLVDPVKGNFDAEHLREVNRRIFQDLPKKGFKNVYPGQFRPPVDGAIWYKERQLTSVDARSLVVYSNMDSEAINRLDKALIDANPNELRKLKTAAFTEKIGKLYGELDYIHPFRDGNSRTLRSFTKQLAKESGYSIDWERFNQGDSGRDVLYIARDLSVNAEALKSVQSETDKITIQTYINQFEGNKTLPELLPDAIRPSRAIAFEKLPRAMALKTHPELKAADDVEQAAEQYFKKKFPNNERQQEQVMSVVTNRIQMRLDAGYSDGFTNSSRQVKQERNRGSTDIER